MNELIAIQNYQQLKTELNEELNNAANSFVRIGFLLKLARDEADILEGSGYSNVNEFASAEFGLDKTQVSRFIRINDRFSEGGNSGKIQDKYSEYGSAKLSLMLTLPDEINEELSPDYSKSDIQAIKEDYEAEQKITDLEVMMEEKDPDQPDEFIALVVKQLNDEHEAPIVFFHNTHNLAQKMNIEPNIADVKEAYIPDGDKTYNIRIAGQGRFMVSMKDAGITITNMRDPANKSSLSWEEFQTALLEDEKSRDFIVKVEPEKKEKPKKVEKSKVAPVQPKKEPENVQKETKTEEKCPNPSENDTKTSEIEKVEGEIVEEPAMNPPEETAEAAGEENEIDEGTIEDKKFDQQIIYQLEKIIQEIKTVEKTNWGHITDKLRDTIREINMTI